MASISAVVQAATPPRVTVALTDLDHSTVTLYRVIGGTRVVLRGALEVDVTDEFALVRVDGEQPFGVAVRYLAVLTDADGAQTELVSDPVTTTIRDAVISDAIRGVGVRVQIRSWDEKTHGRDSAEFAVGRRIVVVSGPRQAYRSEIEVYTLTDADRVALADLLDHATTGIIQLRQDGRLGDIDAHLAIVGDSVSRVPGLAPHKPRRLWSLQAVESEAWPDQLEASGYTLADIDAHYDPDGTLAELASDYSPGSLLDVALADWGNT